MKTLTLLAFVLVCAAVVSANKERLHPAPPAPSATPTPAATFTGELAPAATEAASSGTGRRELTWVPQLGRYVEHDANTSARTAAGLNAASKVRVPDPQRGSTMLDQPAHR